MPHTYDLQQEQGQQRHNRSGGERLSAQIRQAVYAIQSSQLYGQQGERNPAATINSCGRSKPGLVPGNKIINTDAE